MFLDAYVFCFKVDILKICEICEEILIICRGNISAKTNPSNLKVIFFGTFITAVHSKNKKKNGNLTCHSCPEILWQTDYGRFLIA